MEHRFRQTELTTMSALLGVFVAAMLAIFGLMGGLFQQALAF